MALDHFTIGEIHSDITRIEAILTCGIFSSTEAHNPLFQSALTELLIRMRDLLEKAKKYAKRVAFTDDVTIKDNITDVTSLIEFIRNAVCHVDSKHHNHVEAQARLSFNTIFGKGCLAQIGEIRIESEYPDDIAFFFGHQRLYLKRHLVRAYNEAVAQLKPLLERPWV